MRISSLTTIFTAASTLGVPVADDSDDDCSQSWVTIWADELTSTIPSSASTSTTLNGAGNIALAPVTTASATPPDSTATSSSVTSRSIIQGSVPVREYASDSLGISMPKRPNGSAGFLINGYHLKAPVATDAVPSDASIFTPPDGKIFNCSAFSDWLVHQREVVKPVSKVA